MKARDLLMATVLSALISLPVIWVVHSASLASGWSFSNMLNNFVSGLIGGKTILGNANPIFNVNITPLGIASSMLFAIVLYRVYRRLRSEP